MRNKLATLLTVAVTALSSPLVHAALPQLPPAPAGQAVSELLMLDARQALAAEYAKPGLQTSNAASGPSYKGTPLLSDPADPPSTPRPTLTSIYGVGKRLHAQVVIDGQHALFISGQTRPAEGASIPWRLKRIAPPCIDLEGEHAGVMRLCSAPGGEQP